MSISKNTQKKIFSKESITSIILVVIVFILDRVSKTTIINSQEKNQSIYINDYLNFDLVWNTGISFGLLSQNANLYYHLITLLIFTIIIFLIYLITKADFMEKILFSLILGGAIGNFYDRLFYFAVPDFIDFHIGNFHWFIFNVADIFISLGVFFMILLELIDNNKKNEKN